MVLPAALLLTGSAAAYSLDEATIQHSDGRYTVAFDMVLDAETARVRELMTDYDHLDRLSGSVIRSRVLGMHPDGSRRMQLDMRACVLFLCRTVRRVQDVQTQPGGDITTRAVPALSDFSRAEERWRITAQGNGTLRRATGAGLFCPADPRPVAAAARHTPRTARRSGAPGITGPGSTCRA